MASIDRRNRGWLVRIRRKGSPPISKKFHSKIDASKWARRVERLVELGKYEDISEAGMTTLGEALDRYLAEKTPEKKGSIEESYRISKIMKAPIANTSLAELTAGKITKYRREIAKETSNSNANRYVSLICTCLKTVIAEWDIYLPHNPCKQIKKLREPAPQEGRITPEEEARIMHFARESTNIYLPCIITIGMELGLRRSEIVKLRWEWIRGNQLTIIDTKNGTNRTVPLTSKIQIELNKLPRKDIGRIFLAPYGGDMKSFRTAWEVCLKRAGVQTNFHRLRHEACSRLNEKGFTIPEICAISGHKTWSSLKRYTHISTDFLEEKLNG